MIVLFFAKLVVPEDDAGRVVLLPVVVYEVYRARTALPEEVFLATGPVNGRYLAIAKELEKELQRELDWIVMKSLEKDRTQRYETVDGFISDIRRHLSDEPVLAAAPTFRYKLRTRIDVIRF